MKTLVIVESPTKAKTISRFLGRNFTVESSFGHIRDLPSSMLGIDVEHDFTPKYVIPQKARSRVKTLKDLTKKSDCIILATDEDREGEAIAWHLVQALGLEAKSEKRSPRLSKGGAGKAKNIERIVFHEITKKAIEEALLHPRDIDLHLVDAQQARRILDRIVGYKLSPFLWKKIVRGLSAGRVQSVAVRLIVDREREIEQFKPQEYWSITAYFTHTPPFSANLIRVGETVFDKLAIPSKKSADEILADLTGASYTAQRIEKKEAQRNPFPPFTTSTLQQTASHRLGFSARQTMVLAQQLYEGINIGEGGPSGLITYMRTDSLNLSAESLAATASYIQSTWGSSYTLPTPRVFKTKTKGAQEAHEAIRPTDVTRTPAFMKKHLDAQQYKLYELIWQRFVATQMPPALFDSTTVDIAAKCNPSAGGAKEYIFRATGSVLKFDGFLKVYPIKTEDSFLPILNEKEQLIFERLEPKQHFTEPPPRYSEASLIKTLEKNGIGRPSTYAPILSTIQDRNYVQKNEAKRFQPTEIGIMVNDILVEHFPAIVDIQFTAHMEEELDKIAAGELAWVPAIQKFYEPFEKNLEEKYKTVQKQTVEEEIGEACEKCGKPLLIKHGRFGKFIACSGFPECRNTKRLPSETPGVPCPQCGTGRPDNQGEPRPGEVGELIQRRTKSRKLFYGCSNYPQCNFALWDKPTGEKCPQCGSLLVEKGKKILCSNKECGFIKQDT